MIAAISGPSGSGKTTLIEALIRDHGCRRVVPTTTRPPRAGETPGVDYTFLTKDQFRDRIRAGELVDWDYFVGNYYGYDRTLIDRGPGAPHAPIAVIARMSLRLRRTLRGLVLVFLDAPDDVLDDRLEARPQPFADVPSRAAQRREERDHASLFDLRIDTELRSEAETQAIVVGRLAAV